MASCRNTTPGVAGLPPELPRPATTTDGGALRAADGSGLPAVDRRTPEAGVADYVDRYWSVRWDVPRPSERAVLAHPAIHITVEQGSGRMHGHDLPAVLVHGVVRRTFRVELRDSGWVFGAKFRPGGFAAAFDTDASALTGRVIGLDQIVPAADGTTLRDQVLGAPTQEHRAAAMDRWLADRIPATPDPDYAAVLRVVTAMLGDRTMVRAEDVAALHGVSLRALQRLFKRFVGVGPKWLLARYRLHDAIAAIEQDTCEAGDLAGLAASLGWFDQAHFTREFTALVGVSPLAYRSRPR